MTRQQFTGLLACIASLTLGLRAASAAEEGPIETTVTVDAGKVLRTMDPQRLGGTNVAMWYFPGTYDGTLQWMPDLHARYIRMPGGSWANGVYWNGHGVRGADVEQLKTGPAFSVTLSPFSMTYVRVPDQAKPVLSTMAQKALALPAPRPSTPELRFVLPGEMYAGDQLRGEVIALSAGSQLPYRGTLARAALSANGDVTFDRNECRLAEAVGHFTMKPSAAGELTLTAQSGDIKATHKITVKPSIPRPIVFWDFSNPPVTDRQAFTSDFKLVGDETQRANRAVARVDLSVRSAVGDNGNGLLKVEHLPEGDKLNKANIRGVIVDAKTSADFACEDPNASVMVIMQSPANWWMKIGTIPLKDAKEWKTHQLDVKNEEYFKTMPSAMNIIFVLQANKPVKGSIYLDRIGLMVR